MVLFALFSEAANESVQMLTTHCFLFQSLTAQIGTVLEIQNVENGIDEYRSTAYLTFDQYRYYLFKEVSEVRQAFLCVHFSVLTKKR